MLVTLESIEVARNKIFSGSVPLLRTPVVSNLQDRTPKVSQTGAKKLSLKLENLQTMGSFKIRGILNQITTQDDIVTLSAGNYGRSFAYIAQKKGIRGVIVMPETVPTDRIEFIKKCGLTVDLAPTSKLQSKVSEWVQKGYTFAHPFDDIKLINGYGSIGLEILEDVPDVDIVITGVGGGGLYSGVLAAIQLKLKQLNRTKPVKVIGVEPEGANSMFLSLKQGIVIDNFQPKTIAHGLAPPYAGKNTYHHITTFGGEIVLVTDDEMREAVKILYEDYRILCEVSGVASLAAIISGKINVAGKSVVCILSGGNITPKDLIAVANL